MSTEERTDFRKCGPDVLYETRKIVIKMWKSKVPVEEIARITGLTTKTIYDKIRLYKEGGMSALKPKTRGRKSGEKRTLKLVQEKEIIKIITDKNPDQLKFKCCLWTREVLKQLIREKYGIDMPIRTVGQYLQRWGFTVQRPAKQAMNQKPEAVQTWLHEQYPSIHTEAKKAGANAFICKPLFRSTLYDTISGLLGTAAKPAEAENDDADLQGLRIGSATAKGLGLALELPIVPVPTRL